MPIGENVSIKSLPDEVNIAEFLTDEELAKIGNDLIDGINADELSRIDWINRYNESIKLATLVFEKKNTPWPNASNVKFPLLNLACLQFHARAYPSLVPGKDLLHCKIVGYDFFGMKVRRAERVKKYMNYQILSEMEDWDEDMDKLLITLPLTGTEFKKTYYNPLLKHNVSKHVFAKDLIVNYWAKSLNTVYRKSEILELTQNDIRERVNKGIFLDVDLGSPSSPANSTTPTKNNIQGTREPRIDESTPFVIYESHTFLDMDYDGYNEPYIITVEKNSKKVLRIVARFQSENVEIKDGKVILIIPDEYYTKFSFIPSPDGGFYDIGFGVLIGPLNETVNTIVNQLIDSGTLSNLQSGFISKNLRVKGDSLSFKPGEWKLANVTGVDLKQSVFPLPVREPSMVLFQLLGLLIDAGQKVTSTIDILTGENPGQNQKATTTNAVVENGMRVFTAIYKRLRRALGKEFKKIYKLNSIYLDKKKYITIIDPSEQEAMEIKVLKSDFEDSLVDIEPTADPNAVSQYQKLEKAQLILQTVQMGVPLRPALKRYFDALEIENMDELLPPELGQQRPDPELMLKVKNSQREDVVAQADIQLNLREQDRKDTETALKAKQIDQKESSDSGRNRTSMMIAAMNNTQKVLSDRNKNEQSSKDK